MKQLNRHGKKMKIGKTQKRIMTFLTADQMDFIDRGELQVDGAHLSHSASTKLIYKYLPYFLKEADGMPPLFQFELDGICVEKASPVWIAENIDGEKAAELFLEGREFNTVSEDEKKN